MPENAKKPNRLSHESSPYLLQHAYNPVDWYPWGREALEKAKTEDKLIIVSIGYAACHWCHVMEHESFENEQVAKVMNERYVCIKVDREERPDVDQIYMDALQAMGLQGGWPLNVFLNPEAKPFYGGTYFPPQQWVQVLENVANAYFKEREKLDASAEQFVEHLNANELEKYGLKFTEEDSFSETELEQLYRNFSKRYDKKRGGMGQAPKFPMPVNYQFLLRYYQHSKNEKALEQLHLTLREMAYGGIYDQAGGGFARYSTDENWLVPHFEKMLYDNGHLVSLYSEAFMVTKEPLYKQVVYETINFVERELMGHEGGFFSSLDADSEGVEGKFYVFTKEELVQLLGDEEPLFSKYYNVTAAGNWEHGQNILHRKTSDEAFAQENELELAVVQELVQDWKRKILQARLERVRPGLDDKILLGWNALMLRGLTDAYKAFGEQEFRDLAIVNAEFLLQNMKLGPQLYRNYKRGNASIPAFLEDYALLIKALIGVYEISFEEKYLLEARALTDYVLQHFSDEKDYHFYYTDQSAEKLIARKKEFFDNVIPASNSVMAQNLWQLGLFFYERPYTERAVNMLKKVQELVVKEPSYVANWASFYLQQLKPAAEIAIAGAAAEKLREEISTYFLPNAILVGSDKTESALPLLEGRLGMTDETLIFVCFNKTCQMPVKTVEEALAQINSSGSNAANAFPSLA
ncbi:thioredoxin domain-containing protein [Adhaeribacter sp. BT258]|uniref:Thioredoxin domain-containing protein n=1 Tax=Adhaeribacter terrigena TaxID=2793070 RepID=A0ABS1BYP8_9BACT|nr:thioredoxin domain-containing protein [Adhaeribacter terrigena]MBK0402295.1 thioredoxin domain-containing protein [Adhaeribacter terrigena]